MHTANHGAHGLSAGQMPDVIQRVDHARMSAAQQQNDATAKVNHQRLIIHKRVGLCAYRIQKKCAASVFVTIRTRNFAGGKDSFDDLGVPRCFDESARVMANGLRHAIAHADGA